MNLNQMKQIVPVLDNLYGFGSTQRDEINVLEMHCDEVTSFELVRPDSEFYGIGLHLTFTKVDGHDDLWVHTGCCGKVNLISTKK